MADYEQQGRTDRLEAILRAIENSKQTGIVSVERGKGGVRDIGTIIFLYGQIIDANAGVRTGIDALAWLRTWGTCRYSFAEKAPAEIAALPQPQPAPVAPAPVTTSPLAFINQMLPKSLQFSTEAAEASDDIFIEGQVKPADTTKPRFAPQTPVPEVSFQTYPYTTGPLSPDVYTSGPLPSPYGSNGQPLPNPPYVKNNNHAPPRPLAPYRLLDGTEAVAFMERVRLSRLHRHIFFLLDGQRSASDLVRLTRHPLNEIQRLLSDLEQFGLIKQEEGPGSRF